MMRFLPKKKPKARRPHPMYVYDYGCGAEIYWAKWKTGEGFLALLVATLVLAWAYLSGAGGWERHDAAYAVALLCVWLAFFCWEELCRIPVLGAVLARLVRLLAAGAVGLVYGFAYFKIFSG